jgi:hypothetical protein
MGPVLPVVTVRDFSSSATCYAGSVTEFGQKQPFIARRTNAVFFSCAPC